MVTRRAWLLNFDADEELARPTGYTPKPALAARARALAGQVGELLGPGDALVWPEDGPGLAAGLQGRAWCPTPRALRLLRRAGAEPAPAPPLDVLRRVNHRAFCAALGQPLPGARFVTRLDELEEVVAGPSPSGQWVLKRAFGFAGRGRWLAAAGALDARARAWAAGALGEGSGRAEGLQVEPWVTRLADFSQHGHVGRGGEVVLGAACTQRCDARGVWQETRRAAAGELAPAEEAALAAAAREAGLALAEAGYFGPFGIDAFRWADASGQARFHARCEINARYTMGWATGMGESRPDLEGDP